VSDVLNQLPGVATSKFAIVAGAFVSLFLLERAFPVVSWPSGIARVGRNLSLASLNFIASPLIVIPLTAAAAAHALDWRPVMWSGWPGLVLDLLLLDVWIYWWHRLNHRLPFLWRFHEVHHLDETLDTTSALRFHFGEVVLSALVRAGVIILLAVPLTSVVVFEVLLLLSTLLHHSNLKLPLRFEKPLSLFIVTPSIHWVHHHAIKADTDSNYATVLSIWDRLFSSVSKTQRSVEMKIGVEGRAEQTLPGLLIKPFWH
jgi:sterol desaturase/sphingolipid hydroxylase (fatty acid hydroxylase superfamily)